MTPGGPSSGFVYFLHLDSRGVPRSLEAPEPPGPVQSASRRDCTVLADLRLDNRPDLLRDLGIPGAEAPPDALLLLRAYEAWGPAFVGRLEGDFSFVLVDRRSGEALAGRDPLGERALYYHQGPEGTLFSNQVRRLRREPGVGAAVDDLSVAAILAGAGLGGLHPERTCFADLRQVLPGHLLRLREGRLSQEAWWRPPDAARPRPLRAGELPDLHHEFRQVFFQAVRRRMGDPSTGFFLSGGLDSTAVVCSAALLFPGRELPCFSFDPPEAVTVEAAPGKSFREAPYLEAVRDRWPAVRLRSETGEGVGLLDTLDDWHSFTGTPAQGLWSTWYEGIFRQASRLGIATLLSGRGGNYTLSSPGLPRRGLRHALGRIRRRAPEGQPWRGQALQPKLVEDLDLPALAARVDMAPEARFLRRQLAGKGGRIRNFQLGRHGVQELDPTTDVRLAEFCARAPAELFRRDGETRRLVRDALRGIVPDRVLDRTTRGDQVVGWQDRLREMAPFFLSEVDRLSRSDLCRRFVDWSVVRGPLERLPAPDDHSGGTFRLYNQVVLKALLVGRFLEWVEQGKV